MIDPVRQEALQVLAEFAMPEVRLGQLVANLSYLARGLSSDPIWNMEDEELLAAAREHLERRQITPGSPGLTRDLAQLE